MKEVVFDESYESRITAFDLIGLETIGLKRILVQENGIFTFKTFSAILEGSQGQYRSDLFSSLRQMLVSVVRCEKQNEGKLLRFKTRQDLFDWLGRDL